MNVSLRSNILIIISTLVLPLIVSLFLVTRAFEKDIVFAEKEQVGVAIIKPAFKALTEASFCDNEMELKQSLNEILTQLKSQGKVLQFNLDYLKSKNKESLVLESIEQVFQKTTCNNSQEVLPIINDLILFVGDSSNLVLDPDLDTYYVMDMGTYAFPNLINRLKKIKNDSNTRNLNNLVLKEIDIPRIEGDLQTALSEDINFNSANSSLQKNVKSEIESTIQSLLVITKENLDQLSNDAFIKIAPQIISAHNLLLLSLDEMLLERSSSIKNKRNLFLSIIILLLIVAIIIAFYVYRQLMHKLSAVSNLMNNSSLKLKLAVEEMVSASDSLSSAANESAAAIQETSSSLSEITSMISVGGEHIGRTTSLAKNNLTHVESGKQIIEKMIESVESVAKSNQIISKEVDITNLELKKIIQVITDLGLKIKVINDIVFQTKLLSFNASVESARAGEQGKGFAVVAEEVGNLAQMSGQSAQEITKMLDHSMETVNSIIENTKQKMSTIINNGQSAINESVTIANQCRGVLDEIKGSSQGISNMSSDISLASKEQTSGVHEVNKAVSQLDQATQVIAKDAQGVVSISSSVQTQSDEIKTLSENLKFIIEGKAK